MFCFSLRYLYDLEFSLLVENIFVLLDSTIKSSFMGAFIELLKFLEFMHLLLGYFTYNSAVILSDTIN